MGTVTCVLPVVMDLAGPHTEQAAEGKQRDFTASLLMWKRDGRRAAADVGLQGKVGCDVAGEQREEQSAALPEERQPGVFVGAQARGAARRCLIQRDSAGSEEQLLQPCVSVSVCVCVLQDSTVKFI